MSTICLFLPFSILFLWDRVGHCTWSSSIWWNDRIRNVSGMHLFASCHSKDHNCSHLAPCIFMWVSWIWTQVLRLMQEALCSLIIWDISHQSTKEDRWGEQTNIKEGGTQHQTCTSPFNHDFLLMDTETWAEVLGRQSLSSLCLKRLWKVLWVGISREQFSRVPEAMSSARQLYWSTSAF